ncbi:MAG: hypothetical protein IJ600_05045 [Lachnospiraceae bacterium]|nr:hypothetical protein [Lachnospiraceae bacterium]
MKTGIRLAGSIALILCLTAGCGKNQPAKQSPYPVIPAAGAAGGNTSAQAEFSFGEADGLVYKNGLYGLRVDLPEGWNAYTGEMIAALNGLGSGEYTGETVMRLAAKGEIPVVFSANNDDLEDPEMLVISCVYKFKGQSSGISDDKMTEAQDIVEKLFREEKQYNSFSVDEISLNDTDHFWINYDCTVADRDVHYGVVIYGERKYNLMISIMAKDRQRVKELTDSILSFY